MTRTYADERARELLASALDKVRAAKEIGQVLALRKQDAEAITEAAERALELDQLFSLSWDADMRAVSRWREANPGNDLVVPDRADLVAWLLEQFALSTSPRAYANGVEAAARVADEEADGEAGDIWIARHIAKRIRTLSTSPSGDAREADWVGAAAGYTIDAADTPLPGRSEGGTGVEHAAWMLIEIVDGRIAGRKAHRWLGYAQGLLVAADWLTLEDAKLANKRASDELATLCESASSKIGGDHGASSLRARDGGEGL